MIDREFEKEFSITRLLTDNVSPESDYIRSLGLESRDPEMYTQPMPKRLLSASTDSAGGNTVADKIVGDETPNFYANSGLISKATVLDNLQSNAVLTRKTGKPTVSTTTENTSATESTAVAGESVTLKPIFIRTFITVSNTLLKQTSRSVDMLISRELIASITSELEKQILIGRGSEHDEIAGITSDTDLNSESGTANTNIFAAEKRLGANHVPMSYYWLGNSAMRETLRNQLRGTNGNPILTDDNKIIGYDFLHAEHLPASNLWLLNPEFLHVCLWGNQVEIFRDQKTLGYKNQSRIFCIIESNAKFMHDDAIEKLTA